MYIVTVERNDGSTFVKNVCGKKAAVLVANRLTWWFPAKITVSHESGIVYKLTNSEHNKFEYLVG